MRTILEYLFAFAFTLILAVSCQQHSKEIDLKTVQLAQKLIDFNFTDQEIDSMLQSLTYARDDYKKLREVEISNPITPRIYFDPRPQGFILEGAQGVNKWEIPGNVEMPVNIEDLAFYTVAELSSLVKQGKVTSTQLTQMYISRLKKYGDTLQCVVTLTEERALKQASQADEEIAKGNYKGPLHGIPFGVKDLFAVEGYKTTWGAMPYKDQQIEQTATVVKKLEEAGAVLVAKLTLGALAMGDVWFGGLTKNPWDLNQGSSGSSAGSASATAAGLVAFAIGTETWGSIVSPSTRCGVTGLRPTFGRVSRSGAMALSWSMDKVGPICRNAQDCALVFDVIRGKDANDPSTTNYPFNYNNYVQIADLRIGYLKDLFEEDDYRSKENDLQTLEEFKKMGARLQEVKLPDDLPVGSMAIILEAEAAAAFDELTRSNNDDKMVAQHQNAWPNIFRKSRFIPAVEYIQASRMRDLLIEELNKIIMNYDVIICPSFGGDQLLMTNLTGHPCVVVPNGFDKENHPTSISFIGNLYDEATVLQVAEQYQQVTKFYTIKPEKFIK